MKRDPLSKMLYAAYNAYEWHCKAYPVAARRERVRKKWRNRFGKDLREILLDTAPSFLSMIPKHDFQGAYVRIPLMLEPENFDLNDNFQAD